MRNNHERPAPKEAREKAPFARWHARRAELLALALILPLPAFAKEQAPVQAPAQVEHVDENLDGFLRRLDASARHSPNETSWTHFIAPDGAEMSIHSAVAGTEEADSVYVDTREVVAQVLAGSEAVMCHTHPERTEEGLPEPPPEGEPFALDVPSRDDIEAFLYRLALLARVSGSESAASVIMQRFRDCVMTSNGGYWQLEAADVAQMRERIAAIDRYTFRSLNEAEAIIDAEGKSPELFELFLRLPPEQWKDEPLLGRILEFAYGADTESPDHGFPAGLVRLIEQIRERKGQLRNEPGYARMEQFTRLFFDTERTPEQSRDDLIAYRSFIREEFGIKITWHPIPSEE